MSTRGTKKVILTCIRLIVSKVWYIYNAVRFENSVERNARILPQIDYSTASQDVVITFWVVNRDGAEYAAVAQK